MLVTLPNGSRLHYDDDTHSYWSCKEDGSLNKRLTSASSVCKVFDWEKDKLMDWVARETKAGRDWKNARSNKAHIGTAVHGALESLAAGEQPDLTQTSSDAYGYCRAVLSWWDARQPKVLGCEQFVLSGQYDLAGRFDLRYAAADGSIVLADVKTSGYISTSYHVQLALYELAARECGVGASSIRQIVQVRPDGSWREIESRATERNAVAALHIYHAAARIKREARW